MQIQLHNAFTLTNTDNNSSVNNLAHKLAVQFSKEVQYLHKHFLCGHFRNDQDKTATFENVKHTLFYYFISFIRKLHQILILHIVV